MIRNIKILCLIFILAFTSCEEEFLDRNPTASISPAVVFETTEGGLLAINGAYRLMYSFGGWQAEGHDDYGQMSINLINELRGDDMVVASQGYSWFNADYQHDNRKAQDGRPGNVWFFYYRIITNCNEIITRIDGASGTDSERAYIRGQALALRGYAYLNLVQMFQFNIQEGGSALGVPLKLEPTIDPAPRATVQEVYDQIMADLTTSISELTATTEARAHKSHINLNVAQGILARAYLVKGDWANAAATAKKARTGLTPMGGDDLEDGFAYIANDAWMWGLEVNNDQQSSFASFFSHMDNTRFGYASLGQQKLISQKLYDQISDTDDRKEWFLSTATTIDGRNVPQYGHVKFDIPDPSNWVADYVLMRVEEMYLIEAEALAMSNEAGEAQQVLHDLVSTRDSDYSLSTNTGEALISEIMLHRRVELWGEGFRFLDILRKSEGLDRTGSNYDIGLAKVLSMEPKDNTMIYQVPNAEIENNSAISEDDQNP